MRQSIVGNSGILLLALFFVMPLFTSAAAQDAELYRVLFGDVESKLKNYKNQHADLLAPSAYNNALEHYNKATDDFKKVKKTEDIRNRLARAAEEFKNIDMALWNGKTLVKDVMDAREAALMARAPEFALAEFDKGDDLLKNAGKDIEDGDTNSARKNIQNATEKYRDAELIAIKKSVIAPARTEVEAAKKASVEKYAPQTFLKAKDLLTLAEEILNKDRYAVSDASEKAEQAAYEARHAMSIGEYLKTKNLTEEEIILRYEKGMSLPAQELGFTAEFDVDVENVSDAMAASIKSLKDERMTFQQDLAERLAELDKNAQECDEIQAKLNAKLQELQAETEGQLAAMQAKEADLQKKLEAKRRKEAKIIKIREMFGSHEARVLMEGNNLILRLIGVSFPVGKRTIKPDYFGLLARVQRALREFPEAPISIEGHTDSDGDERYNEKLSTERAESVKSYLLANMVINASQIEAVGYGESRPIASNETPAGRAQNRRIDIVLDCGESE